MKCKSIPRLGSELHGSVECDFFQPVRSLVGASDARNKSALLRVVRQIAPSKTSLETLAGVHARYGEPDFGCASPNSGRADPRRELRWKTLGVRRVKLS